MSGRPFGSDKVAKLSSLCLLLLAIMEVVAALLDKFVRTPLEGLLNAGACFVCGGILWLWAVSPSEGNGGNYNFTPWKAAYKLKGIGNETVMMVVTVVTAVFVVFTLTNATFRP